MRNAHAVAVTGSRQRLASLGRSAGDSAAPLLPRDARTRLSSWWPPCPYTEHLVHPTAGSIKVGFTARSLSERSTNLHRSTKTIAAHPGTAGAAKNITGTPGEKGWTADSGKTSLKPLFGNRHSSLGTMRWKPSTTS